MSERRATDSRDSTFRRDGKFIERLSMFMVVMAAGGGFLILIDPRLSGTVFGSPFSVGGEGFSAELKGAVVTIMLIGGWTAVKEFWLGSSAAGQIQSESISRIAEGGTGTGGSGPKAIAADDVKVEASGDVTVTQEKKL